MTQGPDPGDIATALPWRRLRQSPALRGLSLPEASALSRLSHNGPAPAGDHFADWGTGSGRYGISAPLIERLKEKL